jgi:Protein of unknown function (DUF3540)
MPAKAKSVAGNAAMHVQGLPAPLQAVQAAYVIDTVAGRELASTAADGSRVIMRAAVSCLVAPLPGDRVLTAEVGGETFVVAVLERQSGARDVAIRIETAGDLDIVARRISLRAGVLDVLSDAVTMVGDALNTLFHRSKRIVGNETVVARSTTLHAGQRVSVIAQADVQQAGVLSQTVAGPLAISSHTAVVAAKADIRLNGERINVG